MKTLFKDNFVENDEEKKTKKNISTIDLKEKKWLTCKFLVQSKIGHNQRFRFCKEFVNQTTGEKRGCQ